MTMKQLTVSIAAYNVEAYLDKCLGSFADERLNDGLEVLIVNDGSTDRTVEIATEYVARFPAIFRLIDKKNGGHGSTVNAGMREATGRYFRVVDGDDWVNTENMVTLIDRLASIDSDMVVDEKRTVHMITGEEVPLPLPKDTPYDRAVPFLDYATPEYCDYYNLHTVMIKTSLLREYHVELREGIFYVDYEFILKSTSRCREVTFLHLDMYRYLIGNVNQSVDSQNYVRRISHHRKMTEEVLRFASDPAFTGACRAYLDRRVALLIHTHYNIAWIYNKDRKQGAAQGRDFRAFLEKNYPQYAKATSKRYHLCRLLHALGVDYDRLQKLMRR